MKFIVVYLVTVLIIGVFCLLGLVLEYRADLQSHKPEFKVRQCFQKQGLRETWEKEAAGIIWKVGYLKYLVMYAREADRRYAGPKDGWEEDIETFDAKYQVTPCPLEWMPKK